MANTNDTDIYQGLITTEWGGMVNNNFNAYQVKNVYADMYGTQSQTPPANDTGAAGINVAQTAWEQGLVDAYIEPTLNIALTGASVSGSTVTLTTATQPQVESGGSIVVSGLTNNAGTNWANANGTFTVTAIGGTSGAYTVSYSVPTNSPTSTATYSSAFLAVEYSENPTGGAGETSYASQFYLGEVLPNVRSTYIAEIGD